MATLPRDSSTEAGLPVSLADVRAVEELEQRIIALEARQL